MTLTKLEVICCSLAGLSLGAAITFNMDTVTRVLNAVGIQ